MTNSWSLQTVLMIDVCFCYFPVTTTFRTQVLVTSLMG